MPRRFDDWLQAFVDYSDHIESPKFMRFWAGVGAIAGALRRKVWIDQFYFKWSPNFFIIFVAPPGVVTKSTTADLAMDLLREVPGIHFGPNNITWQALVGAFAKASEHFPLNEEFHPMSAITLVSRELGSLLNPKDQDLVNLFIELWDGSRKYEKETKMSGNDIVEAPWVNLLGATTPTWIAENMPASMIGGGFVSRCIFLYAEEKAKYVAYPGDNLPAGIGLLREYLVQDLEHISITLCGEYKISREAKDWGKDWYETMWKDARERYDDEQVMGYLARKQTHVHKLAMVLSAAKSDNLVIQLDELVLAEGMLQDIEMDMAKVFAKIGKSPLSTQTDKLLGILRRQEELAYEDLLRRIQSVFPDFRDFEGVLGMLQRANLIRMYPKGTTMYIAAVNHRPLPEHNDRHNGEASAN